MMWEEAHDDMIEKAFEYGVTANDCGKLRGLFYRLEDLVEANDINITEPSIDLNQDATIDIFWASSVSKKLLAFTVVPSNDTENPGKVWMRNYDMHNNTAINVISPTEDQIIEQLKWMIE